MKWLGLTVLLITLGTFAPAVMAAPGHDIACQPMANLQIPDVSITSAERIAGGLFSAASDEPRVSVPEFCRVQGVATPTADSHIEFEVWIPTTTWNGKFQAVGVGGYQGSISYGAMITALKRGYAVEGNDTGHKGGDLTFGVGHPEKITDWSWRAMHVSAQIGKLIVRDSTGVWPEHSYFVGCSSGGHQALSEAQRFPGDFDGIVAGDPGYNRVNQTAGYLFSWLALHDEAGASLLSNDKLKFIAQSAIARCGDENGVIQEPRACAFDPATLQCKHAETDTCLTGPQIEAVKKVYAGARNPRTGERIYSGWTVGSEAGWSTFLNNPKSPMRNEVFGLFLFGNPDWDYRTFDFDSDLAFARSKIAAMAATSSDLSQFKSRGGKLLMYTGWMDPVAPPEDAAAYYASVANSMGSKTLPSFFRFFMVPGMTHCQSGPGATEFDMLAALERWVENGEAPDRVIALHTEDGNVTRSRPLCPYPTVARYSGKGDRTVAASYACEAPSRTTGTPK